MWELLQLLVKALVRVQTHMLVEENGAAFQILRGKE